MVIRWIIDSNIGERNCYLELLVKVEYIEATLQYADESNPVSPVSS